MKGNMNAEPILLASPFISPRDNILAGRFEWNFKKYKRQSLGESECCSFLRSETLSSRFDGRYARVDRRPLDPPPVVLLKMYEVENVGTARQVETEIAYELSQPSPKSPTHANANPIQFDLLAAVISRCLGCSAPSICFQYLDRRQFSFRLVTIAASLCLHHRRRHVSALPLLHQHRASHTRIRLPKNRLCRLYLHLGPRRSIFPGTSSPRRAAQMPSIMLGTSQ